MNKLLITIAFVFAAGAAVSCKKDVARKTAEDAPSSQNKYVESVANEHLAADSLVCDTVFHEADSLRADSSSVDTCSFGLTLRKTWIFDMSWSEGCRQGQHLSRTSCYPVLGPGMPPMARKTLQEDKQGY